MCGFRESGVKVYTLVTSEFLADQWGNRYSAGRSLLFHGYVSEVCVSKGTAVSLCSAWAIVSALCLFPANGKKSSYIYWTGTEGITWDSKASKFGFLQASSFHSGESRDVLHLHYLLLFPNHIVQKERHRHRDATQPKRKQE